jgi:microsomal dipeptidase-like Zn-dependent dipeptidase
MLNMFIAGSNVATLDQLLDHVDHFAGLLGPEHVGLGPDCMEQMAGGRVPHAVDGDGGPVVAVPLPY